MCTVYLNAWDEVEQRGRHSEPFTKIIQDSSESFTDFFLQISLTGLTSVVSRAISYPDAKEVLLESLSLRMLMPNTKRLLDF